MLCLSLDSRELVLRSLQLFGRSVGLQVWNQIKLPRSANEDDFYVDVNEDGVKDVLICEAFITYVCVSLTQGNSKVHIL